MTVINLSTRVRFVNPDGTLTPEAYRSLYEILERTGGALGSAGADVFVSSDYSEVRQGAAGGDLLADVSGATEAQSLGETVMQPATDWPVLEMVMQSASEVLTFDLPRHTTTSAPAYQPGRMYYDTTLGKARIGGATAYETITSA